MKGFIEEAIRTRKEFAQAVLKSPWDTKARTAADDLLIMYDQLVNLVQNFHEVYFVTYDHFVGQEMEMNTYARKELKKVIRDFQMRVPGLREYKK